MAGDAECIGTTLADEMFDNNVSASELHSDASSAKADLAGPLRFLFGLDHLC